MLDSSFISFFIRKGDNEGVEKIPTCRRTQKPATANDAPSTAEQLLAFQQQ